jgi:hypothetical protein
MHDVSPVGSGEERDEIAMAMGRTLSLWDRRQGRMMETGATSVRGDQ